MYLLLAATAGLLLPGAEGAHRRSGRRVEPAADESAVLAEHRPLQTEGADGTVSTGAWKTVSTSKAGSNVLIAEGIERSAAVKDHQAFLSSDAAKPHEVFHTTYQVPYAPARSHPGGARVGQAYTEFFVPKMSRPSEPPTFRPPLVKTGYFEQRNKALAQQKKTDEDAATKKERIRARVGVCTLCDNAVRAGRIIVENEVHKGAATSNHIKPKGADQSTSLARADTKGLVTLVTTTCDLMTQNYRSEVPQLDCAKISSDILKYYDVKFEGNVRGARKIIEQAGTKYQIHGPSRRVNFALTAALQSCDTLFSIKFCDAEGKPTAPAAGIPPPTIPQLPSEAAAVAAAVTMPDASLASTVFAAPPPAVVALPKMVTRSSPDESATSALVATSTEAPSEPLPSKASATVIAALGVEAIPAGGCDTSMPGCQPGAVVDTTASINDPLPTPPKSFSSEPYDAATSLSGSRSACSCDCCENEPACACASTEVAREPTEAKLDLFLEGVTAEDFSDDVTRSMKHMLSALLMLDDTAISIQMPSARGDDEVPAAKVVAPTPTGPATMEPATMENEGPVQILPHAATGPSSEEVDNSITIVSSLSATGLTGTAGASNDAEESPEIVDPKTVMSASVPTVTTVVSLKKSRRRRLLLGMMNGGVSLDIEIHCDSEAHVKVVQERWQGLCGEKLEAAVQLILPASTSATCGGKIPAKKFVEEDALEDEEAVDPANIGKSLNETDAPLQDDDVGGEQKNTTVAANGKGDKNTSPDDDDEDASEDEGDEDEIDKDEREDEDDEDANEDVEDTADESASGSGSKEENEDDEDMSEDRGTAGDSSAKSGSEDHFDDSDHRKRRDAVNGEKHGSGQTAEEDEDGGEAGGVDKDTGLHDNTEGDGAKGVSDEMDGENDAPEDEEDNGGAGEDAANGNKEKADEKDEASEIQEEMNALDESITLMSKTLAKETADANKETGAAKKKSLKEVEEVTDRLEKAEKALSELSDDTEEGTKEGKGALKKDGESEEEKEKENENHLEDEGKKAQRRASDAAPQFRSKSVSLRGFAEAEKPVAKKEPFFIPHAEASGVISLDDVLRANGI